MRILKRVMEEKMKKPILVVSITLLLFILACVTVNINFPAAEVQNAADKIVEDIHGIQEEPAEGDDVSLESMFRRTLRGLSFFEGVAYAQVDIDVSTPNIRALRQSLKDRFTKIRPLLDKGVIGEGNDGMVSIRSLDGLDLKSKAGAKKLVKEENGNRKKLYAEMTKANDLPSDSLPQIKKLFANSWRKNARKGWWVQKDSGEWVKKGAKK
jgi:uncharacterized protein YdbL (DUF1318 family)